MPGGFIHYSAAIFRTELERWKLFLQAEAIMNSFRRCHAGLLLLGLACLLTAGCSKNSQQYIASGKDYLARGKCSEAIIELRNAVNKDPDSSEAHYQLALGQLACGRIADAYQSLMKTLKLNPGNVEAHLSLANLLLMEGKLDEAIQYAQKASMLAPNRNEAHLIKGSASLLKGDAPAGASELELYVHNDPADAVGHQRLGAAYLAMNDLLRAEFQFEAALKLDPGSTDALAGIANLYLQQKAPEKAVQRLSRQLEHVSGDSRAQILKILAEIYISQKNPAKAEELYTRALQTDPHNASLRSDMAAFYEWNGNPGKSAELLQSLALEQTGNIQIRKQLAALYLQQKSWDKGLQIVGEILKANAMDSETQILKSRLLSGLGKTNAAIDAAREALKADPQSAAAAIELSRLFAESGENLDEALSLARMAKQKLPESTNVADTLAWISYHRGDLRSAIEILKKCVEKEPRNPVFHYHLGMSYFKTGDKANAKASLSEALHLDPVFPGADEARSTLGKM